MNLYKEFMISVLGTYYVVVGISSLKFHTLQIIHARQIYTGSGPSAHITQLSLTTHNLSPTTFISPKHELRIKTKFKKCMLNRNVSDGLVQWKKK